MFYCTTCAEYHNWPQTLFRSWGVCEECGTVRSCHDFPSAQLAEGRDVPVSAESPC